MLPVAFAFCVVLLDQATKDLVQRVILFGEVKELIPGFFALTHVRNTGAVWGVLQNRNADLILLSVLVLAALAVFHRQLAGRDTLGVAALGLISGGIVGNLLDRLRDGWVTDFLDFHIGAYRWPAFNVADSAICAGVALYVLTSFWAAWQPYRRRTEDQPKPSGWAGTDTEGGS